MCQPKPFHVVVVEIEISPHLLRSAGRKITGKAARGDIDLPAAHTSPHTLRLLSVLHRLHILPCFKSLQALEVRLRSLIASLSLILVSIAECTRDKLSVFVVCSEHCYSTDNRRSNRQQNGACTICTASWSNSSALIELYE